MKQKRIMQDAEGHVICGFRKKMMSAAAHITVDDQSEATPPPPLPFFKSLQSRLPMNLINTPIKNLTTLAIATIKRQGQGADIYLHKPPMHIDNVTTNGLPVAIHIDGNVIRKEYDFMMGNMNDNPFKIARVVRKVNLNGQESYSIEIGPNVDVAFMSMCTYAIDELFSDNTTTDDYCSPELE